MEAYIIKKEDIINRVYFITKLVQNQNGSTMQGALTSKSDAIGGIFDRFINTLSDSIVFDKIIFQIPELKKENKALKAIDDFYFYNPKDTEAGIAPDIIGMIVDDKVIPFSQFNNKWEPVDNMPQIEVKTYKAKDQMITLRNQHYDDKYLVLVDLDLRIDYLVPFLDKDCLNPNVASSMQMSDSAFIIRDEKGLITNVAPIDFSSNNIGTIQLIAITNATDFMKQATYCGPHTSVRRIKEIKERRVNVRNGILHEKLSDYASQSPRVSELFEFNQLWADTTNVPRNTKLLDFEADNIEAIEICRFNQKGFVITATQEGCTLNGVALEKNKQYTVNLEDLDRSGNNGEEYFMQKHCAHFLRGLEEDLTDKLLQIIRS